ARGRAAPRARARRRSRGAGPSRGAGGPRPWSRNVDYFVAMPVSIERDLDFLERSLTSLRVDYERFFAGDLKVPPVAARRRVEEVFKRVGNVDVARAAEKFRLQALQGRYTALTELWD